LGLRASASLEKHVVVEKNSILAEIRKRRERKARSLSVTCLTVIYELPRDHRSCFKFQRPTGYDDMIRFIKDERFNAIF